jgi:hypothetical protein
LAPTNSRSRRQNRWVVPLTNRPNVVQRCVKSLIYVNLPFMRKIILLILCLVLFSINIGLNGQNFCDIIKSRMFLLAYCNI